MKKHKFQKGFSLIELSIVIIIIGILIAGLSASSSLINKAKLSTAKSLTNSSPVASIKDLFFWLEATSEKSFSASEPEDGDSLSTWLNINPRNQNITQTSVEGGSSKEPKYKLNCINNISCVQFNGDYSNFHIDENVKTDNFSIFVVFQLKDYDRLCCDTLMSTVGSDSGVDYFDLKVISSGRANFRYHKSTHEVTALYTGDVMKSDTPTILDVIHKSSGATLYHNGSNVDSDNSGGGGSKRIGDISIGYWKQAASNLFQPLNGYIGEIIIFTRALKNQERQDVEQYLGQKWDVDVSQS